MNISYYIGLALSSQIPAAAGVQSKSSKDSKAMYRSTQLRDLLTLVTTHLQYVLWLIQSHPSRKFRVPQWSLLRAATGTHTHTINTQYKTIQY